MTSLAFDRDAGQILIPAHLFGPLGERVANFLLDTGSQVTSVDPDLIYQLGYSAREGRRLSRLVGPGESGSLGFVLRISALEVLGTRHEAFDVHVHDQPREDGIDGLLGMDWLREHALLLDGLKGLIDLVR